MIVKSSQKINTPEQVVAFYKSVFPDCKLFPLNKRSKIGDPKCKTPLHAGWQTRGYTESQLASFLAAGHPLGVSLGDVAFVVDVDAPTADRPDKTGPEELTQLESAIGCSLAPLAVFVVTSPTGGQHYYFRKSADLKLPKSAARSIDIKTGPGAYVVAAGSPHWQGGEYQCDFVARPVDVPSALLSYICRNDPSRDDVESAPAEAGCFTVDMLKTALDSLDPSWFKDREDFIRILFASRHATNGDKAAMALFVEWAASDPEFAGEDHRSANRQQWVKAKKDGITARTLLYALREHGREDVARALSAKLDFVGEPMTGNAVPADERLTLAKVPAEDIGQEFLQFFQYNGDPTLVYWKRTWFCWRDGVYSEIDDQTIRAQLVRFVTSRYRDYTSSKVNSVVDWLEATCTHFGDAAPSWIGQPPASLAGVSPESLLVCSNGIISIDSIDQAELPLVPLTPRLFNMNKFDFDMKPRSQVGAPTQWLAFLDEVFNGDQDSICTLQQWFGYVLTNETQYQKMLIMLGPPRSGKGTIGRVLMTLLGVSQYCCPTGSQLGDRFGLVPLVGKKLALISDCRMSRASEETTERLLSITGEDSLNIDRKNKELLPGVKLTSRLMILSNEMPGFIDSSAALSSRILLLNTRKSFEGVEDYGLLKRLLGDLPGIVHWAKQGYDALTMFGRFDQPDQSKAMLAEARDSMSPMSVFVREYCSISPEAEVEVSEFVRAYRSYCLNELQRRNAPDKSVVGRELRALLGASYETRKRTTADGSRSNHYHGISLTDEGRKLFF